MKAIVVILGFLFGPCCFLPPEGKEESNLILGKWCTDANQLNYPTLIFEKNGHAIFSSRMDTVYTLKYSVRNGYLNLIQPSTKVSSENIIKLTKDSLILGTLLEHKTKQIYYRCK